jgi:hypothetical protein
MTRFNLRRKFKLIHYPATVGAPFKLRLGGAFFVEWGSLRAE